MAHILLVDDDIEYRAALKSLLTAAGHQVEEAEDGVLAQEMLGRTSFDITISDIRMPKCDGIQLLTWSKSRSKMPIVLITGFSEILEATEAAKIGADGFLAKPFKFDDVEKLIKDILSGQKKSLEGDVDDQYCRVSVENFITGSNINFNIFHRITNTKYIKIANRGEDIVDSRIENYKSKGMRNLYLTKSDYAKYVGFNISLRKGNQRPTASDEKKRSFVEYTAGLIFEQVVLGGVEKEEFGVAKDFTLTTIELIHEQAEVISLLEALNKHGVYLYTHALSVSLYSVLVARELKWHWTPKLFNISLAGLLHDIGLKEVSKETIEKSRLEHTAEERRLFETHSARGMEILNQISGMSDDVILTAYQHHELNNGEGYPQHLHRLKIHPVARLVGVIDVFCDHVIQKPGQQKVGPQEALKMMSRRENSFEPEYFSALKKIFKFNPTAEVVT